VVGVEHQCEQCVCSRRNENSKKDYQDQTYQNNQRTICDSTLTDGHFTSHAVGVGEYTISVQCAFAYW